MCRNYVAHIVRVPGYLRTVRHNLFSMFETTLRQGNRNEASLSIVAVRILLVTLKWLSGLKQSLRNCRFGLFTPTNGTSTPPFFARRLSPLMSQRSPHEKKDPAAPRSWDVLGSSPALTSESKKNVPSACDTIVWGRWFDLVRTPACMDFSSYFSVCVYICWVKTSLIVYSLDSIMVPLSELVLGIQFWFI